jgi:hypothetical protein
MIGPTSSIVISSVSLASAVRAFPRANVFQRLSGVMLKTVLTPTGAKASAMLACLGLFIVGFSAGRACWKRWPILGE